FCAMKRVTFTGVVAGAVFGCMTLGLILGALTCYKCSRMPGRKDHQVADPVQMTSHENLNG
ncbi:hypothetical protein AVEN_250932-1, partial [Araneus ventricosus]